MVVVPLATLNGPTMILGITSLQRESPPVGELVCGWQAAGLLKPLPSPILATIEKRLVRIGK